MSAVNGVDQNRISLIFFIIGFIVIFPIFIRLPLIPIPMPIGIVIISLFSILLIGKYFFSIEKLIFPINWVFLISGYIFTIFISLFVSAHDSYLPYSSLLAAFQMILPIGTFFIFLNILNSRKNYISIIYGAYSAVFLFSILVLLSKNNLLLPNVFEDVHPVLAGPFEFYQFRQYVGTVMAAVMLLGLFMPRSKFNDLILLIFSFIIVLAISEMFTSAGAMLSLVSFMLIAYRFLGFLKLILVLPIIFIALFYAGFGIAIQEAVSYELLNIARAGNRFEVWSKSIKIIKNSPIIGNGFRFDSTIQERMLLSHSQPLNTFTRAGIFPFLIWICIIFYALYRSYGLVRLGYYSEKYYGYVGLLIATIQLLFFASMVTTNFDQPYSGTVIWLYIALIERSYFFLDNEKTTYE